ncbi:MAG: hypothetical protein HRU12_01980, partial [Phaeodactylibacter sp.]|nr:hypothetical protein [Phaeodactylibacter sp.]
MYALRVYLGEERVNSVLKQFIQEHGYAEQNYPTSIDLLNALDTITPDSLKYLITDGFRNITLYDNAIETATYTPLANGQYEVAVTVNTSKRYASETGSEAPQPLRDYIEVGIYGDEHPQHPKGTELYRAFLLFDQASSSFKTVVDELPHKAVIDPRHLLIDRSPNNNELEIEMASID